MDLEYEIAKLRNYHIFVYRERIHLQNSTSVLPLNKTGFYVSNDVYQS